MLQESFSKDKRNLRSILLSADFVVVGGGISGICAAVSAARAGVKPFLCRIVLCLVEMRRARCDFGYWVLRHIWATITVGHVREG